MAGLVEHELLVPLAEKDKKRWLYVTPQIDTILSGKGDPNAGFPSVEADVVFGRYCKSFIVNLSRKMKSKADFKRLAGLEEAWTMQLPGPGSGWRLFGRFARKNVFVGLDLRTREECGDLVNYNGFALAMIADWNARFAVGPLVGTKAEDYVSQLFWDEGW